MFNCFSHVQLFATLWTVASQAPLSMGFSRQEYWSGLPCPPLEEIQKEKLLFPCSTSGKEPACQCRRHEIQVRSLGQEDPLREGHGNPLQYSCLENLMNRGSWWSTVHGISRSQKRLGTHTRVHTQTQTTHTHPSL